MPKTGKYSKIEFMAMGKSLPINSKAMLNRLLELLEENDTNCLADINNSWHVKTVMWMLMSQIFGQLKIVDLPDLWQKLYNEYHSTEV
jgi:hypothetical protein